MYQEHSVGVVVPAYNEAEHVGEVIDTVPGFVDRVYAVDDRSTDGTWDVIRERARATRADTASPALADGGDGARFVVPIRHGRNRGVGGAVKTGYRRALEDGMDVIAVMNGDGQMDPDDLDRILDPVVEGRAGYAKGDRLHDRASRRGMSGWRTFGNALLTLLTKASSGYWKMTDSQNGYTAIHREALERLPLADVYEDYGFLNDMLTRLNVRDVPVANVPHSAVYGDEQSGIAYSSFVPRLSALLLRNFCRRLVVKHLLWDFHPLAVCYLFGVAGLATAAVAGGLLAGAALDGGATLAAGIGTVLLVLVSALLLSLGVAFDIHENEHLEASRR